MPDPKAPELTEEQVLALAKLANLELTAPEIARITKDLDRILAYVAELGELDLEGVPPTAHVELERLPLRADEPGESLPRDLALREAPRVSSDGFAVPAFVDEG